MKMRCPTVVEVLVVVAIATVVIIFLGSPSTGMLSPLLTAASGGDASEVRRLIDAGLGDVKEHDGRRRTALHYAAYYGKQDAAKVLIEKGANIECGRLLGGDAFARRCYLRQD